MIFEVAEKKIKQTREGGGDNVLEGAEGLPHFPPTQPHSFGGLGGLG